MKKTLLTGLSALSVALGAGAVLAPSATAAEFSVPVTKDGSWFKVAPYANAKKVYSEFNKGDKAIFKCYVMNEHGNKWYEDALGNYIYSGNVAAPKDVPGC
ncbi:hypothetical protein OHB12_12330 [Nocardia sp. NBC_01730]|uniref:hypothetical protein n=1 Tax=Nocardia sp. NBC_01730 TaxID=2975998 RepID=UPI002E0E5B3E|nr:hypothetical protein OHB12_12330 [Nocardia sp. NBC_01730]